MKLSNKNQALLFDAISDSITDLRVDLQKPQSHACGFSQNEIDKKLFNLELKIWGDVKKILKIKN